MRTKYLLGIFAASTVGLSEIGMSEPIYAAACPDPSTLTSINTAGDATSFDQATGGYCDGTPDSYGVTIYKMGFCVNDPRPSEGATPDYSSCSITYENNSGTAADFAAGTSVSLDNTFATKPANGDYGYLLILLGSTFSIKAQYGPVAGVTYYTTQASTGQSASANTTGPAVSSSDTARSFGSNCDSEDSLEIDSGILTGSLLNSSKERILESSSAANCGNVKYILGVVSLGSPLTIDENVTALKATFKVTDNGTTISIDNSNGLVFGVGPFNVTMTIISR